MQSLSAPGMKDNTIISHMEALILKSPIRYERVEQDPSCAATWNKTPLLLVFWVKCSHVTLSTRKNKETSLCLHIYTSFHS